MLLNQLAAAAAEKGAEAEHGVLDAILVFVVWLLVVMIFNPWPTAVYSVAAGLFSCFLAYRFLVQSIVFWGITYGASIGYILAMMTPGLSQEWVACYVAIGAVAGVGAILLLHHFALFLIGAAWAVTAMRVILNIIPVPYVGPLFLLAAAVYGGVMGYRRRDEIYIVTSAIWGAELAVGGVITIVLLAGQGGDKVAEFFTGLASRSVGTWERVETEEDLWLAIIRTACIVVLSALGMLVQFRIRSKTWWMKDLEGAEQTTGEPPAVAPDAAPDDRRGFGWKEGRIPPGGLPAGDDDSDPAEPKPGQGSGPILEPGDKKKTIPIEKRDEP